MPYTYYIIRENSQIINEDAITHFYNTRRCGNRLTVRNNDHMESAFMGKLSQYINTRERTGKICFTNPML